MTLPTSDPIALLTLSHYPITLIITNPHYSPILHQLLIISNPPLILINPYIHQLFTIIRSNRGNELFTNYSSMIHQLFTIKPHYSSSIPHYLPLLTIYEPMIHQLLSTVVHPFLTLNPPFFTNYSPMIQPLFINYSSWVIPPIIRQFH